MQVPGARLPQHQHRSGHDRVPAAKYGVDRVAIVDTDCHHGRTQDIYWHDRDTLFISPARTAGLSTRQRFPQPSWAPTRGFQPPLPPPKKLPRHPQRRPADLDDFKLIIVNSAGRDNHTRTPSPT
jgi:hypothetical protein